MSLGYRLSADGNRFELGNGLFSVCLEGVENPSELKDDFGGLSEEFTRVSFVQHGIPRECLIWDDLPVLEFPDYRGTFSLPAEGTELVLRTVRFAAATDYHDTPVTETDFFMYRRKIPAQTGNIFILSDPVKKTSYVFISLSPDCVKPLFSVDGGVASLENEEYGIVVGRCATKDAEKLCRAWYRHKCKPSPLFTLANNWGDLHAPVVVYEDFIIKELEASKEMGLDVLQIDDGWQTGDTSDKSIRDETGHRTFYGDFWKLNEKKFPNGMETVRAAAEKNGVGLGLWFAPHSKNAFELLDRDVAVLKNAYDFWGSRFFKLDMLRVENREMHEAFKKMVERIYSFGKDASIQFDVTNGHREGFFSLNQYGRLFAENRYTGLSTYYPHRAARNLYSLCKYIPAFKFQFELVNPTLNRDKYPENDPLAPCVCDEDYLFACVMTSNPLFWMETQFLPQKQRDELKRILPVWKEVRRELARADVVPVGERPDGGTFSGFAAYSADGKKVWLTALRQVTEENEYTFSLDTKVRSARLLDSNTDAKVSADGKNVTVTLGKNNSYAFIELEVK